MKDQQDLRKLGGLVNFLPFTYTAILVGSLSLMAFPFLTGFFSKDLILELAYGQYELRGNIAYWLGTVTAAITAFYSFRLISMTFFTVPNAERVDYETTHEQPLIVALPLTILSLLAIFFGYIARDLYVGIGRDFLSRALFIHPDHVNLVEAEFAIPTFYKLLPAIGSLIGAYSAVVLYNNTLWSLITVTCINILNIKGKELYTFLNGKYFFDVLYNNYVIYKRLTYGLIMSKIIDRGAVEMLGPFGITNGLYSNSKDIAKLDTGIVTNYALYIILALITLILILFLPFINRQIFRERSLVVDVRYLFVFIAIIIRSPIV